MSNHPLNSFFLFFINKVSVAELEQNIYKDTDLENHLEEEVYIELISFDFKQEKVREKLVDFILEHLSSKEELILWSQEYYAPVVEAIYGFAIQAFFEGAELGSSTKEITSDTNYKYTQKDGDLPYYKLTEEFGEAEDITLYYSYKANTNIIDRITLIFESFFDYYYKSIHGPNAFLEQAIQDNNIDLYTIIYNQVCSKIIAYLTSQFGTPSIEKKSDHGIFNQPYHQYYLYKWKVKNTEKESTSTLYLMKYIDDSTWHQIFYFMKMNWIQ
jgi:hypothetical protein